MPRLKQTARKSPGGKAPRKSLAPDGAAPIEYTNYGNNENGQNNMNAENATEEHLVLESKIDKIYEVVLDIQKEIASLKSAEHRGGARRQTRRRKRRT